MSFGLEKTEPILICVCGGGGCNGCFVASDWLKKQGIKASHVLSIHYVNSKKKTLKQESGRKEPFLHPFLFARSTSVTKKAYFLLKEKGKGEEIILSVTEVHNVQSCNTLPPHHYFIRRDAFLADVRHIMNAAAFKPTRKHAIKRHKTYHNTLCIRF